MNISAETFANQAGVLQRLGLDVDGMAAVWGVTTEDVRAFARSHNLEQSVQFDPNWQETRQQWLRDRSADRRAYKKHRSATDPSYRVENATRARIWAAIKGRSDGRLFSRLGYSLAELMTHIEGQFLDGMCWDNYGQWHIDHIRPCAKFDLTDADQFNKCWALSNLQPLWAIDNIRKGAKCPH